MKQDKSDKKTFHLSIGGGGPEGGPQRVFTVRFALLTADKADDQVFGSIAESITQFERQRRTILLASDQPIEVGDIALVQEDESKREFSFRRWRHLKSGFDWQRLAIAGGIAGFAIFIYALARGLGWVIDGFVSIPKG